MKYLTITLLSLSILTIFACNKDRIKGCTDVSSLNFDPTATEDDGTCVYDNLDQYDAVLYADYENPLNGNPQLIIDDEKSSVEINIEQQPVVSESNGRILFGYSGVTFKKDKEVFAINDLITERKNGEKWIIDDENFLSWTFSKSLDVIIVLDVSASLGENIQTVKNNAKEIVSKILGQNDEAQIGILKFSRGNVYTELTSSIQELHAFIDINSNYESPDIGLYEIEGRSETALYEAVNTAIGLLNDSDARGKGILTFTDGINNFQFDPTHFTPDAIIEDLKENNISSYTIGFQGNQGTVDKSSLESISINGDFSFPTSLEELNEVFIRFSNTVAAVYDLEYNTNNAKFNGTQEYRFLFNTVLIND